MRISRSVTHLLFSLALLGGSTPAFAQISISINLAPPALPIYEQPEIPDDGYIWTPGYWAYGDDGYFWVPGTWVQPPNPGLLWTPGYWAWQDGVYGWNAGYWGPHVGYYGGINYGYGYGGEGYEGGHWDNGHFAYNRAVNNITNTRITNVYNQTVIVNNNTHVAYNGGNGGTMARASAAELAVAHEQHVQATEVQARQQQTARADRNQFASVNHGQPPVAATMRPAEFSGHVVAAKAAGEPYRPEPAKPAAEHPSGQPGSNEVKAPGSQPRPVAEPHETEHHPAPEQHMATEPHPMAPHPEETHAVEHPSPAAQPHPPERPREAEHHAPSEQHMPVEQHAPVPHAETPHPAEHPNPAAAPHPAPAQQPHPADHPPPPHKPGEPDNKQ